MSSDVSTQWEKELRLLLAKVDQHPSADLTQVRERIVVLQQLIRTSSRAAV